MSELSREIIRYLKQRIEEDKESLEDLDDEGRGQDVTAFMYEASIEAFKDTIEFIRSLSAK